MDETKDALPIGSEALERAIGVYGVMWLSREIGVAHQQIRGWFAAGRKFATPAEHCPGIERATGVRCEDLRPDVAWDVLRAKPRRTSRSASPLPKRRAA